MFRVVGLGDRYKFGVHNNSIANVYRGLLERVFKVQSEDGTSLVDPPLPKTEIFHQLKSYIGEIRGTIGSQIPISRSRFLLYYTGAKHSMYARAVESLSETPLQKVDSHLKTFVKAEKINFTLKSDPAPRVIQPRSPRYNVELGRFIKPVEGKIYRAIDKLFGHQTIMKHVNVEQIAQRAWEKWNMFDKPVAIGFDASRFDQHVSVAALHFEHRIYKELYCFNSQLEELLEWQINNVGTAYARDGYANYSVRGRRMSGDMNTALGNCILASLITLQFIHKYGIRAQLLNNGDDCVLICSEVDEDVVVKHLASHWLDFGFKVICEAPVRVFEHMEFCQMQPVLVDGRPLMVRNPHVTLDKDSYCTLSLNSSKVARQWLYAVGSCGLSLTGGVPVVQSYYQCCRRNGFSGGKLMASKELTGGFFWYAKYSHRMPQVIQPNTRLSFYRAFGWTPDEQVALEAYYDALTLGSEIIQTDTLAGVPECLLLSLTPPPQRS